MKKVIFLTFVFVLVSTYYLGAQCPVSLDSNSYPTAIGISSTFFIYPMISIPPSAEFKMSGLPEIQERSKKKIFKISKLSTKKIALTPVRCGKTVITLIVRGELTCNGASRKITLSKKLNEMTVSFFKARNPYYLICGDVDYNGKVDIIDALEVARFSVGAPGSLHMEKQIVDVNNDDQMNIIDSLLIAQY